MYIDSHAHLTLGKFDGTFRCLTWSAENGFAVAQCDREGLLDAMARAGIAAIVEPGIDMESNERLLALAAERPGTVFPAVGSPSSAIELDLDELFRYSKALEWIDVCKLPE